MKFINTKRFSPVIYEKDLPHQYDLFHKAPKSVPDSEKDYDIYLSDNNIITDDEWWEMQKERCLNGYLAKGVVADGGDNFVDGIDVIKKGDKRYIERLDFTIIGNDVWIPGRMYFYLNFWKIKRLNKELRRKTVFNPAFTDLSFENWIYREIREEHRKHMTWFKRRQVGLSEETACDVAYDFLFYNDSQSVIIAGLEMYSRQTMNNVRRGLEILKNTQFYKVLEKGGDSKEYIKSKYTDSEIYMRTAKDNPQVVSSLCLAKDTKVIMYNGEIKLVQDLRLGDKLLGPDSKIRTIKSTTSGIDDLYKITSKKCDDFIVNSNHLLYCYHQPCKRINKIKENGPWVYNNFKDKDIIPYDDNHYLIRAKDFYLKSESFKKTTLLEKSKLIKWKKQNVYIEPYFLGLWLGDGDKSGPRITTVDNEIENYLLGYSKRLGMYLNEHKSESSGKAGRYLISSVIKDTFGGQNKNLLKQYLKYYDILNNKYIPQDYLINDEETRLQLLAGLIDTDGYRGERHFAISQVDNNITEQIVFLVRSLGFYCKVSKETNRTCGIYKSQDINTIYISGEKIYKIPVRIKRKIISKNECDDIWKTKHSLRGRMHIDYIGKGEYYGFELVENGLFLLNDFTITHNTPSKVVFEEVGKWKKGLVLETKAFIEASSQAEGFKTGLFDFIGTAGEEMKDSVSDMLELFYNPDEYDILAVNNIYDDEISKDERVGYFIPGSKFTKVDEDYNSLIAESEKEIKDTRLRKKGKERFIYTAQFPLSPSEMFQTSSGGYFGQEIVQLLNERYTYIKGHASSRITRRGILKWNDIHDYSKGCHFIEEDGGWIEILEEPEKTKDGLTINNLYVAGTDSYDQDEAYSSTSKGCTVIKKKVFDLDKPANYYVAMVLLRPTPEEGGAKSFYEKSAMACIYYNNAINNIEYANLRIFDWYEDNGLTYLLKIRPQIAFAGKVLNTKVSNRYGTDKSLKPHILAIKKDNLTKDEIDNMYFLEQISAFAKFKYYPGLKYNCDITMASAECDVCHKDEEHVTAKAEQKEKKKLGMSVYREINGNIVKVFI